MRCGCGAGKLWAPEPPPSGALASSLVNPEVAASAGPRSPLLASSMVASVPRHGDDGWWVLLGLAVVAWVLVRAGNRKGRR